jgi:hypothetical protein
LDASGQVVFLATIQGSAVHPASDSVVVSNGRTGVLEVLAREGAEAPGTGGTKFKEFTSVSITGDVVGGTLFTGSLQARSGTPAVTAANDAGAWWLPAGESAVMKLVPEGDEDFAQRLWEYDFNVCQK